MPQVIASMRDNDPHPASGLPLDEDNHIIEHLPGDALPQLQSLSYAPQEDLSAKEESSSIYLSCRSGYRSAPAPSSSRRQPLKASSPLPAQARCQNLHPVTITTSALSSPLKDFKTIVSDMKSSIDSLAKENVELRKAMRGVKRGLDGTKKGQAKLQASLDTLNGKMSMSKRIVSSVPLAIVRNEEGRLPPAELALKLHSFKTIRNLSTAPLKEALAHHGYEAPSGADRDQLARLLFHLLSGAPFSQRSER